MRLAVRPIRPGADIDLADRRTDRHPVPFLRQLLDKLPFAKRGVLHYRLVGFHF